WLRFGEIMRGSLSTGCWQKEHLTVNVSQSIWRHDSWRRLITVRPVLYRLASIVQDAP
ncbi:hypothetical protein ACRTVN_004793, partial [Salmonella enterica subsp. enterica serovar Kentucky]